jgi:3-oxoacid CoA-transferase subunit A
MPVVSKLVATAADAISDIEAGSSIACGGFGLSGVPYTLIDALVTSGVSELCIVSNNCGTDGRGLGRLLEKHQVARVTGSFVGENKEFARQFMSGELEVQLIPQGTLSERLRAAGCGIPAFYTPAGVGTLVADGGIPWRYGPDGQVTVASPPKEVREFDGSAYVLEQWLRTDFALVRASRGDTAGNLCFDKASRNFNPLCAMAARVSVAEVEELVEPGELAPDAIHLPGVFVDRVVQADPSFAKVIERRVGRPVPAAGAEPVR